MLRRVAITTTSHIKWDSIETKQTVDPSRVMAIMASRSEEVLMEKAFY